MNKLLESIEIDNKRGKERPVYEQIAVHIKGLIESSQISPGARLPSISDMMKKWDVAYPTIKTALDVLEEDNLIRLEPGRGKGPLVLKNPALCPRLKFIFHRLSNEAQFLNLEKGMRRFTGSNNIELSVIDSEFSGLYLNFDNLIDKPDTVTGLILYPMDDENYLSGVKKILEMGVRVIFVDRFFPNLNISSVCADNFAGGYMACEHLISNHDIPVYFFGNVARPSSTHLRYQGWFQSMREHFPHLCSDRRYIYEIPLVETEYAATHPQVWGRPVREAAEGFVRSLEKEQLVSVFCSNDDAARTLMEAAAENGRTVGGDFFVAGFGNKPFCERIEPTLTSVMQPDEKMGYEAARVLSDMIANPNLARQRINRVVPVELKIRESSIKQ
ncbi:Arabinose metabolism transcriptional repressor [Limihaloglobus sulfuriphilus]|uniref:Arabinose metabolism transcriptional repressor n=1 Tax=Limihaloglobus sulfuriphilus TaxID=1851148 RepID=A0A1R7T6A5_9BACT|nr:GntR family transcriptional regulator [Limihaloglobus sulfuriphilus]AQQ72593.1 Arabinose metabolism transcriptional repressor [Limihaloglobus sulfuriphilus]